MLTSLHQAIQVDFSGAFFMLEISCSTVGLEPVMGKANELIVMFENAIWDDFHFVSWLIIMLEAAIRRAIVN